MSKIRTYTELIQLPTFEERFRYLKLTGKVGVDTFGFDRAFNQEFYTSSDWKSVRDRVIIRDMSCDLGIAGRDVEHRVMVHHMNPLTLDDIVDVTDFLLNPEYLITVSFDTHNAIHYGGEPPKVDVVERRPGDTRLW